jgi:hypothetical protein
MANLLQSSQNKTTCVPSFYTNYLTNLATKGQQAACEAKYVGAQPLQTEAFKTATENAGAAKPAFQTGMGYLGCAATKDISGAAAPFLCQAFQTNTGQLAQCYMSPYINNAIQGMSDVAMRNIQQNIAPQATAAAVGSGQFGSQRGAQVAGQLEANAMQDLNTQIANLLNTGYGSALNAATQRQALLNQLGSTAATAGAECARAKQAAGVGMGQLGTSLTNANIACVNALATLGGQEQTIAQNAQCYNLAKYAKLAGIMQGAQIPTSVKTTMCMSPFSGLGAIGSGVLGVLCKYPDIMCKIGGGLKNLVGICTGVAPPPYRDPVYDPSGGQGCATGISHCVCGPYGVICACSAFCFAHGGSINPRGIGAVGCASTRHRGGLPQRLIMANEATQGGLPNIGIDVSKAPLYGSGTDEYLQTIQKAQEDAVKALQGPLCQSKLVQDCRRFC